MKNGLQMAGHGIMNNIQSLPMAKVLTTQVMSTFYYIMIFKELPYPSMEIMEGLVM